MHVTGNPVDDALWWLAYPAFVRLLLEASLVLTDSGGVQEEAACLGRPTLVLRDVTERPDGGVRHRGRAGGRH